MIQEEQLSVNGKRMYAKYCKLPLGGLSRNCVVRITDCMTSAVYRGRKVTNQNHLGQHCLPRPYCLRTYHNDPKFKTDRPWQTVNTQIRQKEEEQSDQCLHCLPFDRISL